MKSTLKGLFLLVYRFAIGREGQALGSYLPPMQSTDILIVGAGPAGLRAAELLARAGREVLVLERHPEVGPKTCGGGLSVHSAALLEGMGLPPGTGRGLLGAVSFCGEPPASFGGQRAVIRTVSRRELGAFQLGLAVRAGAMVRTATPAGAFDFPAHTLRVHETPIRYRVLIGADGGSSVVRHALGLPTPRELVAGEFNIPGLRRDDLFAAADSAALSSGYWWVFPHSDYTSVGAGAPKHQVRPDSLRAYVESRCRLLGIDPGDTPWEGAVIETSPVALNHADDVYLVGEAAGLVSALTAEGIYGALLSGEAVARRILDPEAPAPLLDTWRRTLRQHRAIARLAGHRLPREVVLRLLAAGMRQAATRRGVTRLLVGG